MSRVCVQPTNDAQAVLVTMCCKLLVTNPCHRALIRRRCLCRNKNLGNNNHWRLRIEDCRLRCQQQCKRLVVRSIFCKFSEAFRCILWQLNHLSLVCHTLAVATTTATATTAASTALCPTACRQTTLATQMRTQYRNVAGVVRVLLFLLRLCCLLILL